MENTTYIFTILFVEFPALKNTYQSDLVIEKSTNAANLNCDLNL